MVTPVISSVTPFDASVGTTFSFSYVGGITDSYFQIFNLSNVEIYDSRNDVRIGTSQLKRRAIPSATTSYVVDGVVQENPLKLLLNNEQYYLQVTVINGDESATSQKVLIKCITTPLLSVYFNDGTDTPLPYSTPYILNSASLSVGIKYEQAIKNGVVYEDLNSYQFILYDNSYNIVYTSSLYYNYSNTDIVWCTINGLEEKRYFLKVMGKTINGYVINLDMITIDVEYHNSTQKTALQVQNCYEEGFVKINTNIHALMYELKYEPAKFVDDVIQLRDNWLDYYDGLTIDGDYVAYVRFKNPNYNRNLVRIVGDEHEVYMNCYKHNNYYSIVELEEMYGDDLPDEEQIKSSFLYFDLVVDTDTTHVMLTSDIFDTQKMEDAWFNAYIVRKGNIYSFLVLPDKYKLTYVLYDGFNDSRNPLNYAEGDSLYFYNATKRGNIFKGWYLNPSFSSSSKVISPFTAPGEPMTVYARFTPCVYTISYVLPSGATHSNPTSYTYGTTTTLSNAKKTGYNFIGWYTEEEFENKITEIGNDEINDKILYANFEPMIWNMTYYLNYGTNNSKNPSTYTTDAEVMLYSPTRQGYTFKGWYYDYSFTNEVPIPFIAPISNTTVYAKWAVNTYNISYVDAEVNNPNPTTYTYGSSVSLQSLSRTGYTFGGWYLDDEYTLPMSYISSTTYGDLVLYAKWNVQTYTISYINATDDNPNPTSYTYGTEIVLQSLSKEGYDFGGWYTNSSYTNQITSITSTMSGNLTLYAKWNPKTYNITYVVDADVENTNPTTHTYGTTTSLNGLSRTGYTFSGWYIDEEYTTSISYISSTSIGDITLYAKWTPIYYKIAYNVGFTDDVLGNTISVSEGENPTSFCLEDDIILSDGVLSGLYSDSYIFDGWYTGSYSSYSGVTFNKKITNVSELSSELKSTIILYPKLIAIQWFAYYYNDSTMTATLKFTNIAPSMNEFYIPAEYNGYKVASIELPSQGTNSFITNKLNTEAVFNVDENNEYYFSDSYGNMFYHNDYTLKMVWYNDSNSYCKESVFTNAMQKVGKNYMSISGSAFIGHNGLEKIAICDGVGYLTPYGSSTSSYTYHATAFKGCNNLKEIYFTASDTETGCISRASYYSDGLKHGRYVDSYVYSGSYVHSNWQPTTSCTIYVKDSSIKVGIDSKQTISKTYNWTLPDELK